MNYYHINKDNLSIVSGPHSDNSTYIKKLTCCGNPILLDLSQYNLVPQIYPVLLANQRYNSTTIVSMDRVEIGVEDIPLEEQFEVKKQQFISLIQIYLDDTVQSRGYDNILSLCSYATSTDEVFSVEGQSGVVWRDSVWRTCYSILNDVQNGVRSIPTEEELMLELPIIQW